MDIVEKPDRRGLSAFLRSHPHPGGIIVSEKYRFIYMKPCRTGGTSILRRKLEYLPLDTFHFKDDCARFLQWIRKINDRELTSYRIFSFVRNPWDRGVSIAAYFRVPLGSFLDSYQNLISADRLLLQHSLPLHEYTHHNGKPFVDMIGRFEQLQSDFETICHSLGIAPGTKLEVTNRSQRSHYVVSYNAETKEKLKEIYSRDIELFNYKY